MTAARIYAVAEQHVAADRYPEAVQLVRHALLQLPESTDADALRHRLLLRLAYLQMLAFQQTGDRVFVDDAQRMLERYLVKHEALFGTGDGARAERDEVYEILYAVETLREPEPEQAPASEDDEEAEPETETEIAANDVDVSRQRVDDHAGETLEAEMKRPVRVSGRSRLARPDDPRVRERLESDFSLAERGPLLTLPGVELVHGPRPLVRARGLASAVGDATPERERLARRLGHALLVQARPDLRRCYEAAFARTTVAVTEGTIEASIRPDGTVAKARIVEGGLVDALGDVCLIERIEATRIAADTTRTTTRVRLPLLFFYEGPVYMYEATGETFEAAVPGAVRPVEDEGRAMPPIDSFAR